MSGDEPEIRDFQFSISLLGGRLASVKVPVPITKRNLERFTRLIKDQLEPFLEGDDADDTECR